MRDTRIQRKNDFDRCLVAGKQNATGENRATQPHRRTLPKSANAVVNKNALYCLNRARPTRALRPRLDDVKRLRTERSHHTSYRSVGKVDKRVLLDVSLRLEILEDIIRAHSKRGCTRLLQRSSGEATIQSENPMLLPDDPGSVETRSKAPFVSRVINKSSLDTFRGRDGSYRCHDASCHAGCEVAERREGAGFRIGEGMFDLIEEQKANAVFCY